LTITVTAYDWWWKSDYGEGSPQGFSAANEIHVPVGEPVLVKLKSADVIHAFWVPVLAGKTQTIPGQVNQQWIQADKPGVYRGQCTQYCGAQHAHMAFEVVAQSPQDYANWYDAQARPAAPPATVDATRGQHVFMQRCAGCHAVRGTEAAGVQAPDLTHLRSRRLIAAGTMTNSPQNVMEWIAHAQEIKPRSLMPDIKLSPNDSRALAAYLATLN
jgi:cytochrome c oxidase subunit 2